MSQAGQITYTASGGTSSNSTRNAGPTAIQQSPGSAVGETIYREIFDGNFTQICTSNDEGTSMAIYVERAVSGGSSAVFTSDIELNGQGGTSDECTTINATIARSDLTRDLDFRIPVHEKVIPLFLGLKPL